MRKGLIVTGGHVNRDLLFMLLKNKDSFELVVGVDGGMNPLWVIGVKPDYILGDFDSCDHLALEHFRKEGVPEVTFQAEKDMTDTELAIMSMIERGMKDVVIVGGSGSRMDHTLANLMLLSAYSDQVGLTMMDTHNRITLAKKAMEIQKDGYHYLSLLPLSDQARGVTLTGVKYPLTEATLERHSSYGVSNEIQGEVCELTFEEGVLLIIQSND